MLQLQSGFVCSENVFPTKAAASDISVLVLYVLAAISLQMMIELAN